MEPASSFPALHFQLDGCNHLPESLPGIIFTTRVELEIIYKLPKPFQDKVTLVITYIQEQQSSRLFLCLPEFRIYHLSRISSLRPSLSSTKCATSATLHEQSQIVCWICSFIAKKIEITRVTSNI